MNSIQLSHGLFLNLCKNAMNVNSWIIKSFGSDNSLQNSVKIAIIFTSINDSWTIDKINSSCEGDVLPNFSFSRNWSSLARFASFQGVDDGGFSDVGISDESDSNRFTISVEVIKLEI
jgi:hypothetical protein